jgi:glycosyltransferase involved in cell wall biosynthesis
MNRAMASPLVSVILCTYNRGHLVFRAIRSVLRQTWKNRELIIIDDGSTDGSGALLDAFARRTRGVRYFRQVNHGLAHARNVGSRMARGTLLAFLDSDDEYTPMHLARLARYLRTHHEMDAVYGRLKPVGPRSRQYVPDADRPGRRIHVSRCHAAGTLMVRRTSLRLIGGFRRIPFSEDYDLIRRLEQRFQVVRVPFRTYRYHVGADHRLCDLFAKEGAVGIRRFRREGTLGGRISPRRRPVSSRS